jgi:Ti-type conjugative transfer relaxase TraA
VIANSTSAAGRATTLDGRALYAHARTAGFLYQATLRQELTQRLGVAWGPVENGVAELRGIDEDVRRTFSRRSAEIREHMRERDGRSSKSAQIATLETRRAKDYNVPIACLREEWRARAAELGLGPQELDDVLDRQHGRRRPDVEAIAEALSAPHGLTAQASAFDRRDVVRGWAEAHRDGASVKEIERLADDWIQRPDAVRLDGGRGREQLGGARYSTVEMLRIESRLLEDAAARRSTGAAKVDPTLVESRLRATEALSAEQRAMVRTLTTSGAGVELVRAAAGTGKTRALAAARDLWEEAGIHVYGCAIAARAAVELEHLSGIDSSTIARLVKDLDQGYGLRPGSVLVVDEAGMVGTRALARLAEHAAEAHSKLVLVGDDHQLPEIDAGGAFRGLAERLGATELHELRRQSHGWDRAALTQLRNGEFDAWADAYRDHGRLVCRPTAEETRLALVDDWWESARADDQDSVMIAHRRADVAELNAAARERMRRDGRLGQEELAIGPQAFAVGDRVIARRNDRRRDIVNGTRAEVVEIDQKHNVIRARTSRGSELEIDSSYLDNGWLEHGYALTAHAAQGATVERSFVLGGEDLYREWGYTALTRHSDAAKFYMVSPGSVERTLPGLEAEEERAVDDLRERMAARRRKSMALEVARAGDSVQRIQDRIERLAGDHSALHFWQRGRRRELEESLARQHEGAQASRRAPDRNSQRTPRDPARDAGSDRRHLHPRRAARPVAGRGRDPRSSARAPSRPGAMGPCRRPPARPRQAAA